MPRWIIWETYFPHNGLFHISLSAHRHEPYSHMNQEFWGNIEIVSIIEQASYTQQTNMHYIFFHEKMDRFLKLKGFVEINFRIVASCKVFENDIMLNLGEMVISNLVENYSLPWGHAKLFSLGEKWSLCVLVYSLICHSYYLCTLFFHI